MVAKDVGLRRLPDLRISYDLTVPVSWGIRRSTVCVPASMVDWSLGARDAVLRHEFTHIRRRDVLTQRIASVVTALWWFLPPVHVLARRMRIERELACDDAVLETGIRPSAYARLLLDIVRTRELRTDFPASGLGCRSDLEVRVASLLDPSRPRDVPARDGRIEALATSCAVLLLLAAFVPQHVAPAIRSSSAPAHPEVALVRPVVTASLPTVAPPKLLPEDSLRANTSPSQHPSVPDRLPIPPVDTHEMLDELVEAGREGSGLHPDLLQKVLRFVLQLSPGESKKPSVYDVGGGTGIISLDTQARRRFPCRTRRRGDGTIEVVGRTRAAVPEARDR